MSPFPKKQAGKQAESQQGFIHCRQPHHGFLMSLNRCEKHGGQQPDPGRLHEPGQKLPDQNGINEMKQQIECIVPLRMVSKEKSEHSKEDVTRKPEALGRDGKQIQEIML